jgi:hypothetical protein
VLCIRRSFAAPSLGFRLDSHLGLSRRHRIVAARIDGDFVFDGKLAPREPRSPRTYAYIVLRGELRLPARGSVVPAGSLLVAKSRHDVFEVEGARHVWPFRALGIQVERALFPFERSEIAPLAEATHTSARELFALLGRRDATPARLAETHARLLDALRRQGLAIDVDALLDDPPPTAQEHAIARALSHALSQSNTRPALVDLTFEGLTERTARRLLHGVAAEYGFTYPGWRSLRRAWSAAIASILLTCPASTPASVCQAVGFSSPASLCHALNRAGLLAPRALQAAAIAARG